MVARISGMSGDDRTPVFVISVAAELAGMHAQTLRQYDRIGLVTTSRTRGGGRRYSAADVSRVATALGDAVRRRVLALVEEELSTARGALVAAVRPSGAGGSGVLRRCAEQPGRVD